MNKGTSSQIDSPLLGDKVDYEKGPLIPRRLDKKNSLEWEILPQLL